MQDDTRELLRSIIREELEPIKQKVNTLEYEQRDVKQAVIESQESVKLMQADISAIKQAVMETNQAVQRLESIQEQQHRIIEMLSARSLQQEAELRRIK